VCSTITRGEPNEIHQSGSHAAIPAAVKAVAPLALTTTVISVVYPHILKGEISEQPAVRKLGLMLAEVEE